MSEGAKVKGTIIKGAKDIILDKFGEKGYKDFLEKTPPEDLPTWEAKQIIAVSLIPAAVYRNMSTTFESVWGDREGKLFQEIAGKVAIRDLGSFMKFFMKVGTPSFVAQRFPTIWKQYFTAGEYKIIHSTPNSLEAVLEGTKEYGIGGCYGTLGWTRAALEYAGAKSCHIDHSECLFENQSACRFIYEWK